MDVSKGAKGVYIFEAALPVCLEGPLPCYAHRSTTEERSFVPAASLRQDISSFACSPAHHLLMKKPYDAKQGKDGLLHADVLVLDLRINRGGESKNIYVGSSINLYNRVFSYFMPSILSKSAAMQDECFDFLKNMALKM
jgi:hypothetical protein